MRALPVRRRYRSQPPIELEIVAFEGGVGLSVDFGPALHELNMAELAREMNIKWPGWASGALWPDDEDLL